MIRFHGGPITPNRLAIEFWRQRHAMVSFARPDQIGLALEHAYSVAIDNGAWAIYGSGESPDWDAYCDWVHEISYHPAFAWAIIPDKIGGTEEENDALLERYTSDFINVPVWHMHESLERLEKLVCMWPLVALGSSGEYPTPGVGKWWPRMEEAMEVCCDSEGRPHTKLHGLRMMDPKIFGRIPFTSVDSTNVARNHNRERKLLTCTPEVAALSIASRAESAPCASVWEREPLTLKPRMQMELIQ